MFSKKSKSFDEISQFCFDVGYWSYYICIRQSKTGRFYEKNAALENLNFTRSNISIKILANVRIISNSQKVMIVIYIYYLALLEKKYGRSLLILLSNCNIKVRSFHKFNFLRWKKPDFLERAVMFFDSSHNHALA